MSSCQCCLTPHPLRLLERFNSSIQTIKLIRRNCSIFENILLDEYEYFERILLNLNKYLMNYGTISNQIYSYLSQFIIQLNNRLENLTKFLYEIECLTIKCSIWLKNNSIKTNHFQLKQYRKKLNYFLEQYSYIIQYKNNLLNKFLKDFSLFQTNYKQQCLQMDSIEYESMKIFIESIQLFFSIISLDNNNNNNHLISTININDNINQWKEKNKFRITWLPDEHHQKENNNIHIKETLSDIEIKQIDYSSNDSQETYAYKSNLSWSFTIPKKKEEDLLIPTSLHSSIENSKDSQSKINIIKSPSINRVRLAIEAIERNTRHISRERKS